MTMARVLPSAIAAALLLTALGERAFAQTAAPAEPPAAPVANGPEETPKAPPPDTQQTNGTPHDEFGPFAVHGQATMVDQANAGFHSTYVGPNSLWPHANGRETVDVTLFAGVRLWRGAELWIDPEVDQGFGLTGTLGVAGFPSGEAYKVGAKDPYLRLQRFFIRQTINLGGETEAVDADLNQMSGSRTADRIVITVGKVSVVDIFDVNKYAHDPRGDFLNWTIIDAGAFDYAADSWGYSAGGVVEWVTGPYTLRAGAFLLSNVPNSPNLDTRFSQFQALGELERRYSLLGRPGAARVTGFLSRGRMSKLLDAVTLAQSTGAPPDPALVRRYAERPGISLDLEQELAKDLGAFARVSGADGRFEAYEFTDVDRSVSAGLSLGGARWGRADDILAAAGVINEASKDRRLFLAEGGLGILIGDGQLPRARPESILEGRYEVRLTKIFRLGLDSQWIANPGYNRDRGPVAVFAFRLHAEL